MKTFLLASLLAFPLIARAEGSTSGALHFILDVEYWGTLTDVQGHRLEGQTTHGIMHVNSALAPADRDPSSLTGSYSWNTRAACDYDCPPETYGPSGFVTADGQRPLEHSRDYVFVLLGRPANGSISALWDDIGFDNAEDSAVGPYSKYFMRVRARSPVSFLNGDGLLQHFDIRPSASGGSAFATLDVIVNGVQTVLKNFAIDRLRVTPKVCRP